MALRGGAPRTGFRFPIARETPNMYRNNALVRLGIPANTGHWGGRHVAAGDFWSKLAGIGSKVLGVAGTVLTATGIGAPLGLALGGASALLGATQTPHPNQIALPGTGGGVIGAGPGIGGAITIGGQRGVTIGGGITTGGGAGGFTGGGSDVGPSSGVVLANGAVVVTKGHHLNKHGYYTKAHGWIAPGTVLVRNRHRNPLNPRAARRAASRLHGMQKLIGRIERVVSKAARGSGRRVGPRLVASGRRGHKPGCGCFACKRRRSA
jgi:hypothetical protein